MEFHTHLLFLGHVLIEKVLFDKSHFLSKLSYIIFLKTKVLSV